MVYPIKSVNVIPTLALSKSGIRVEAIFTSSQPVSQAPLAIQLHSIYHIEFSLSKPMVWSTFVHLPVHDKLFFIDI